MRLIDAWTCQSERQIQRSLNNDKTEVNYVNFFQNNTKHSCKIAPFVCLSNIHLSRRHGMSRHQRRQARHTFSAISDCLGWSAHGLHILQKTCKHEELPYQDVPGSWLRQKFVHYHFWSSYFIVVCEGLFMSFPNTTTMLTAFPCPSPQTRFLNIFHFGPCID